MNTIEPLRTPWEEQDKGSAGSLRRGSLYARGDYQIKWGGQERPQRGGDVQGGGVCSVDIWGKIIPGIRSNKNKIHEMQAGTFEE